MLWWQREECCSSHNIKASSKSFTEQGWIPHDSDPFRAASPNHRSRYQGGAHCDEEAWEGSSEGYSSLEGILNS